MRPNRAFLSVAWAAVLCGSALAGSVRQEVLSALPNKAGLVVLVPSIGKLASGLAEFGKAIDVVELASLDAPSMLETALPFIDGIDLDGTFALCVIPGEQPQPLVIFPLSDPAAWKKAAQAAGVDVGDAVFTMSIQGQEHAALVRGNLLMLSQEADVLKASATSAAGDRVKLPAEVLEQNQFILWLDVSAWKATIDQNLGMFEAMAQMGMMMSGQPGAQGGMAYLKWVMSEVRALLADMSTSVMALRVSREAAHWSNIVTLTPGSPTAEYVSKSKKGQGHLLRGLPGKPAGLTIAAEWEPPPGGASVFERMLKVAAESAPEKDRAGPEGQEALARFCRELKGLNVAIDVPREPGMRMTGHYFVKDARAAMKDLAAMIDYAMVQAKGAGAGLTITHAHSSEKIGGGDMDVYRITVSSEVPAIAQFAKLFYGDEYTLIIGPAEDGLALAGGSSAAAREQMARLLERQGAGLKDDARVKAALQHLAPNPQSLCLVDVVKLVDDGMALGAAMGAPLPPAPAVDGSHALTALALYLGDNQLRAELYIPTDPIVALRKKFAAPAAQPAEPQPATDAPNER
jgi:hypothetical protein